MTTLAHGDLSFFIFPNMCQKLLRKGEKFVLEFGGGLCFVMGGMKPV